MRNKIISGVVSVFVLASMLVATEGLSQTTKLKPIKPSANQLPSTMSDEQQSVAVVRKAKAAVVSVVGSVSVATGQGGRVLNTSQGTGFIIESNGYIVSNSHVVSDQNAEYSVILLDGTEFPAKVVGLDKYNDIALLKIEATGLATIPFGNSESLETGQSVFAIGNALGRYQNTVTRGVVSGLGRDVSLSESRPRLQNLIQTDAAISPGNSGGPLINLAGDAVGMNTLIDIGGSSLGFAIPINTIKDAVGQIRSTGKATRPYLGISYLTIDKGVRAAHNLPDSATGALTVTVGDGTPAAAAGIVVGDILTEINGEKLTERNELDKVVQRYQAGNQVMVKILRGGQYFDYPLILGEYR
jgi:serine protease Do